MDIKEMNIKNFYDIVSPYSMTSKERIESLYNSLEYIRENNIQGDFVECGVWKGGNILGIISYIEHHQMHNRNVWLFDTFEGMTAPEEIDIDLRGHAAAGQLNEVKCYASGGVVKNNLLNCKYPITTNINFVVGDIVETLNDPINIPNQIALLRLDTDWYQSTKKEMDVLYPLLIENGILIVDDYGHWIGAKKAIDEYFDSINLKPLIEKIDYTGIRIQK